jgi:hypothetical protein
MKFSDVRRAIALIHQAQKCNTLPLTDFYSLLCIQLGTEGKDTDEALEMALAEDYIELVESGTMIHFRI